MKKSTAAILFVFLCAYSVDIVSAAAGDVTAQIKSGKIYSIKPSGCSLAIASSSPSKIVVRCAGAKLSSRAKASAVLTKGKKAVITARSCFLGVISLAANRIEMKCFSAPLTATPTATAAFTETPTPTATPTDTTTPTITPTSTATPTSTITPTSTFTSTPTQTPTVTPTLTPNAQALAINNVMTSFNTANSANSASLATVTGVTSGQTLASIDRRPQNGGLYGLGYNPTTGDGQLYFISLRGTPIANPIGSTISFLDGSGNPERIGVDAGTKIGMDFNAIVDRVRVVTSNGQNFRINPNTGAPVDGNLGGGSIAGVNMDGPITGGTTTIGEVAYTNNSPNESVTTLYSIDPATNALYIQNSPNSGMQTLPLGLVYANQALDIVEARGFDIPVGVNAISSNSGVGSGSGLAILEFASNSQQRFCSVDLTTGVVSSDAQVGSGASELVGLALQSSQGPNIVGLLSNDSLVRFSADSPGTVSTVTLSGLTAGEAFVGLDFRPSTGQLFGLGVNSFSNTATLYQVDPMTGALTVVGTSSQISISDFPDPTVGYGFNFNGSVDRIRVVAGSGLNLRLNPVTGALASQDSAINGAATGVHGVAYTNSFAGASVNTLYALDAAADKLLIQNPANSGTETVVASISVDFDSLVGFDIPSSVSVASSGAPVSSGMGYAAFTTAGVTSLYTLDLVSGAVTNKGVIGDGSTSLRGIAVGEIEAK